MPPGVRFFSCSSIPGGIPLGGKYWPLELADSFPLSVVNGHLLELGSTWIPLCRPLPRLGAGTASDSVPRKNFVIPLGVLSYP